MTSELLQKPAIRSFWLRAIHLPRALSPEARSSLLANWSDRQQRELNTLYDPAVVRDPELYLAVDLILSPSSIRMILRRSIELCA